MRTLSQRTISPPSASALIWAASFSLTRILGLILRDGIALALAGLALGLASAIVLSRLLTRFLYGLTPNDPVTFGVAAVLVGGVALAGVRDSCLAGRKGRS